MLDCVAVPSVIVECGFLSNEKDEKLLTQEHWQRRLTESIAAGVLAYFSQSTS
jgi:N-acetylmuramoyl-L-alanine amidase